MKKLTAYIKSVLGIELEIQPLDNSILNNLPMYLREGYRWHKAILAGRTCILAELKDANDFGVAQIEKHFEQAKTTFNLPIIAVFGKMEAYNRKRLIERRVAFILPDKQLYMPEFFIDLKEYGKAVKKETKTLTPTAQQLFLLHILDRNQNKLLEQKTFKELAVLLKTNPMAITRAAENLKQHELIDVIGDKEKFIRFNLDRHQLWHETLNRNLLINPVIKQVYVDEKPSGYFMLHSNASALPEYSEMNPSRQEFYAIDKNDFYELQRKNGLVNTNNHEGRYCLEVWKYNPELLTEMALPDSSVVDPLSLYLSLKDNHDERIEMALEQIIDKEINKMTW